MYMWRGMYLGRLDESTRSPRMGVTDSCEYVLGTKLKVLLWKNNCSQVLSCLFSPYPVLLGIEPRTSQIQIHPRQTFYYCLTFQTLNCSLFTYFSHHDYYYYIYISKYFGCIYVCAAHKCGTHEGQKKALDPLEFRSQMIVYLHVGAGNWI